MVQASIDANLFLKQQPSLSANGGPCVDNRLGRVGWVVAFVFRTNATAGSMCFRLRNFLGWTGLAPAMSSYSRFTSISASAATI